MAGPGNSQRQQPPCGRASCVRNRQLLPALTHDITLLPLAPTPSLQVAKTRKSPVAEHVQEPVFDQEAYRLREAPPTPPAPAHRAPPAAPAPLSLHVATGGLLLQSGM